MILRFLFSYTPKATFLSQDSDRLRKLLILNILLKVIFFLSLSALILSSYNYIRNPSEYFFSSLLATAVFLLLVTILVVFQKKFLYAVSIALVFLVLLPAVLISYRYGALLAQPLLLYILAITLSGILINTTVAVFTAVFVVLVIVGFTFLQTFGYIIYDKNWFHSSIHLYDIRDAIIASITIVVVTILTWLSNREIEYSLNRAHASEEALKKEKDLLDVRVKERTKQLQNAQIEKLQQINRFATFGRLSSGLIHDLVNPLTGISFALQNVHHSYAARKSKYLKNILNSLLVVTENVKVMERLVLSARKQYQSQETIEIFSVSKSVEQVFEVLGHKAKKKKVLLTFSGNKLFIKGNPVKFHQLIANLVSNAIDAYEKFDGKLKRKEVIVSNAIVGTTITIEVVDYGMGIPQKNINKIFTPLFTTKNPQQGSGMGLYLCKQIVERDFGGKIYVTSSKKQGTVFTITLPYITDYA